MNSAKWMIAWFIIWGTVYAFVANTLIIAPLVPETTMFKHGIHTGWLFVGIWLWVGSVFTGKYKVVPFFTTKDDPILWLYFLNWPITTPYVWLLLQRKSR